MNILTAIWAFLKNLQKDNTKGRIVVEMIKIIFTFFVGYYLYLILLGFTEIPIRDYRIAVDNPMNINQQDKLSLNVNIDYGGKVTNYFKKDIEYGVSLDVKTMNGKNDSSQVKGSSSVVYENFNWIDNGMSLLEYPKKLDIDTVSVIYKISTRQFEIPNPDYKTSLLTPDTTYEYTDHCNKIDKTKGSIDKFRTIWISTTRLDTDKVNNIYQYKSLTWLLLNEGGHDFFFKPSQALEFSKFNIFNLSDISQSDYHICIRFPQKVADQKVNFDFGGATEFSEMQPEPDGKTMTGFYYTDRQKINLLNEKGLWFHAKFHQLENIQMIRLFFLTTLLGIMIGLLLSSFWNIIKLVVQCIMKNSN